MTKDKIDCHSGTSTGSGAEEGSPVITRFAPSPTGLLHLGHAYSAMLAFTKARDTGGRFRLRIEDIDRDRCRPEFEEAILRDLTWLGLRWEGQIIRQSERADAYRKALDQLSAEGVLYPCFCTRKEIRAELDQLVSAPHQPHPVYSGTCRSLDSKEQLARIRSGQPHALRINTMTAIGLLPTQAKSWHETDGSTYRIEDFLNGDEIIARKDIGTSYHLAVAVDDALQHINLVVRGEDLRPSTAIHRILQGLLNLPLPGYLHHQLIRDEKGQRLAKRDDAQSITSYRERGIRPIDVWSILGLAEKAPDHIIAT